MARCCHDDAHPHEGEGPVPGYVTAQDRVALLNRMKRLEGQVRAVTNMIESEAYCIDVLTQITAAKRALEKVSVLLVEDHLRGCVRAAATSGDQAEIDTKIEEVTTLLTRMLKT